MIWQGGDGGASSSDADGGTHVGAVHEDVCEMHRRAAETMLHELAHAPVDRDGKSLPPTAAAKELWLHWVQWHAPHDVVALARATLGVLKLDHMFASERGFDELTRLLPALYGEDESTDASGLSRFGQSGLSNFGQSGLSHFGPSCRSNVSARPLVPQLGWRPSADADVTAAATLEQAGMEADDDAASVAASRALRRAASSAQLHEAREVLPLDAALQHAALRIELRPREVAGWRMLCRVLEWVAGTTAHGEASVDLRFTLDWWHGVMSWWPEACFEVEFTPDVATGAEAPLWLVRQACAQQLQLLCTCGRGMVPEAFARSLVLLRPLEAMGRKACTAQRVAQWAFPVVN
jgi:hypothetical protein